MTRLQITSYCSFAAGDRGAPIGIHLHNRRELTAAHGKTYTLSGMYPEVARKLAADLRAASR